MAFFCAENASVDDVKAAMMKAAYAHAVYKRFATAGNVESPD